MATTTNHTDDPLLPLLALPLELKLQIFSYSEDRYNCSLIILRRTHSSLRHIIPRRQLPTWPVWVGRETEFRSAENKHPYLFPLDRFPCYGCFRCFPRGSTSIVTTWNAG